MLYSHISIYIVCCLRGRSGAGRERIVVVVVVLLLSVQGKQLWSCGDGQ